MCLNPSEGNRAKHSASRGYAMASAAIPIAAMAPVSREHRPSIVGGDTPEVPFPMQLAGVVTRGFGRGARFLGIPTGESDIRGLVPFDICQLLRWEVISIPMRTMHLGGVLVDVDSSHDLTPHTALLPFCS